MLPLISGLKTLVVAWQSFWSKQHGGGDVGTWLSNEANGLGRIVSTLLFALPIAFCVLHFGWLYFAGALLWSYLFFDTGHATAYEMGTDPAVAQSGRMDTLSYIINPICNLL